MIASFGSLAATRRPKSRRSARFIRPVFNRSKVDILLFAMPYSSTLILQLRLGSGCERNERLSSGVVSSLFQGRLATNQCIAAAEVTLKDGHKAPKRLSTIACHPDLL